MSNSISVIISEELDKLKKKKADRQQPRVYIECPNNELEEEVNVIEEDKPTSNVDFDIKTNEFDI